MFKQTHNKIMRANLFLGLVLCLSLMACAYQRAPVDSRITLPNACFPAGFEAVEICREDSFASLAAFYLDDPAKGWLIDQYNGHPKLVPGDIIIIPPDSFNRAGLVPDGFQTVPVLAYQCLVQKPSNKFEVITNRFVEQMDFLKENNYNIITLDQLIAFINYKEVIPPRAVVITFDKGWRSFYKIAWPLLKKYNFPATLFLHTDFIGNKEGLSWKELNQMSKEGLDLQCQTKSLRNLIKNKKGDSFKSYFKTLQKEVMDARSIINIRLGIQCKYIAYPYGKTDNLVVAMLQKLGISAGLTLERGSNAAFSDNFRIKRSMILSDYNIEDFEENLIIFKSMALK